MRVVGIAITRPTVSYCIKNMITVFNTLLKKLIIKIATTHSVYTAEAIAARQHRRSVAVLRVLQMGSANRATVKAALEASNSPGQKQLATVLDVFELLSAEKKAEFITAFKACSSLMGGGTPYIALRTAWQQGNHPPVFQP